MNIHAFLALSLPLAIVACTITTPNFEKKQLNTNQSRNFIQPPPPPPSKQLEKVIFSYHQPRKFSTKNVNIADLAFIKLTLVGPDITGTLTNDGDVYIPITGGTATAAISNVPLKAGNIRVVSVQGYDANKVALPAFVGKGFYKSSTGTVTINISISRKNLLAGLVLERLITAKSPLASSLDINALKTQLEAVTGFNGTNFTTDPTRFDVADIVTLITTHGTVPTSTAINTNASANAQNVTVHLKTTGGLSSNEVLKVSANDPNSTEQTIPLKTISPMSATLSINPGTWTIFVKKSNGALVTKTTVTVSPNGTITLGAGASSGAAITLTGVAETSTATNVVVHVKTPGGLSNCDVVKVSSSDPNSTVQTINALTASPTTATLSIRAGTWNVYVKKADNTLLAQTTVTVTTGGGVTLGAGGSVGTAMAMTGIAEGGLQVSTYIGKPGISGSDVGNRTSATLTNPYDMAFDSAGNMFIASRQDHTIRKMNSAGIVSAFTGQSGTSGTADGVGALAQHQTPTYLAFDSAGILFVSDGNKKMRKITSDGTVTTFAGSGACCSADGVGTAAEFRGLQDISFDSAGVIFLVDISHKIRKITSDATVTTFSGRLIGYPNGFNDGPASGVLYKSPSGGVFDSAGNFYVSDNGNHVIRSIASNGDATKIGGTVGSSGTQDGVLANARFNNPRDMEFDSAGNLYVADFNNHLIRKIAPNSAGIIGSDSIVSNYAGRPAVSGISNGVVSAATFNHPIGLAFDSAGNLYVGDYTNHIVRKIGASCPP